MPRYQALFFAITGVALLVAVSFFISLRSLWPTLASGLAAVLWIGAGFGMKVRARKRKEGHGPQ